MARLARTVHGEVMQYPRPGSGRDPLVCTSRARCRRSWYATHHGRSISARCRPKAVRSAPNESPPRWECVGRRCPGRELRLRASLPHLGGCRARSRARRAAHSVSCRTAACWYESLRSRKLADLPNGHRRWSGAPATVSGDKLPGPKGAEHRPGHSASVLEDGRVLFVGGYAREDYPSKETHFFDPQSDSWRKGPPLKSARADHHALVLSTGEVLITGGVRDASFRRSSRAEVLSSDGRWVSAGEVDSHSNGVETPTA